MNREIQKLFSCFTRDKEQCIESLYSFEEFHDRIIVFRWIDIDLFQFNSAQSTFVALID